MKDFAITDQTINMWFSKEKFAKPHLILKCLVLWWVSVVMLGVWHTAFGILYQELVLVQIQLTNIIT
jgi:hypothetical protein